MSPWTFVLVSSGMGESAEQGERVMSSAPPNVPHQIGGALLLLTDLLRDDVKSGLRDNASVNTRDHRAAENMCALVRAKAKR